MKHRNNAFTLIELLTSMTIIVLLIGLLLPAIAMVRRMAKETAQKAQLTTIDMSLDSFRNDYGDYPPSDGWDYTAGAPLDYCGAHKLAEALVGWDLMGFHPDSDWQSDGYNIANTYYYYDPTSIPDMDKRKDPYLEVATTSAFRLGASAAGLPDGLYGFGNTGLLAPQPFILCDVFTVKRLTVTTSSGKKVVYKAGTPILYYRANTNSNTMLNGNWPQQRYNFQDNMVLVDLTPLAYIDETTPPPHPLENPATFYSDQGGLIDPKVTANWPYRPDSYILISAGYDGLYGTGDDIHNY